MTLSGFVLALFLLNQISKRSVLSQDAPKLNPFVFPKDLVTGSRARVLCASYLGDQPLDFRWLKDGKNLSTAKAQQSDSSISELILEPLGLQHNGNYTCIVSNEYGSDSYTASLFVKAPPMWVKAPEDIKVRIGGKVVLNCDAIGSPEVQVKWKLKSATSGDLVTIVPSSNLRILRNNTLVIYKAQKSDAGAYVCEVSNGVGENLRKSAEVIVFEKPVVESIENSLVVEKGREAHLTCFTRSDNPLSLKWTKNKNPLSDWMTSSDRFSFSEHLESSFIKFVLKIRSVELEDEGVYTCEGKNAYGSDAKDIRLFVIERPYPPEGVEVVDIWSRSARIRWTAPSDGNSPINNYSVEYWSDAGTYQNETVTSSITAYIIRDLRPFTTYSFRVFAVNRVGMSDPSEQSEFTTAKEEPSAPPMDLFVEETGSTYARLSWKPPPPQETNGVLIGYYVGYKRTSSDLPYTLNTVELSEDDVIYYVLRGLRKGTRYLVNVRAYNDVGSGPASQEISFKTHNQEPLPRPNLMVKNIGSTFIQLQWFLPSESKVSGYTLYYRKPKSKWQEISIPDAVQTSFTLTNLDTDVTYQMYVISHSSHGMSEPSDTATVRTTAEQIIHVDTAVQPPVAKRGVDELTQALYIVVPVAIATVIIVIVIVVACVYVYARRPVPTPLPYGNFNDVPLDKNFCYMSTTPRRRDPVPVCNTDSTKQGSPYSTVPLTRSEHDDDEPIYESVIDEIRCKMKQCAFDEEKKISSGTIV